MGGVSRKVYLPNFVSTPALSISQEVNYHRENVLFYNIGTTLNQTSIQAMGKVMWRYTIVQRLTPGPFLRYQGTPGQISDREFGEYTLRKLRRENFERVMRGR
jgi:hypothetical protein